MIHKIPISPSACGAVHTANAAASHGAVAQALWDSLCEAWPELREMSQNGVRSARVSHDVSVRWAGDVEAGFFACEVVSLASRELWDAFVITLPDGALRTGWRRLDRSTEPPDPWLAVAVSLHLGDPVRVSSEPDFLSLVTALSQSSLPVIESTDLANRTDLALELEHFQDLARRQAATVRTLQHTLQSLKSSPSDGNAGTSRPVADPFERLGFKDLETWADENIDRIVILPRAIGEAKRSPYEDPPFVFRCLELLAETYRLVKCSQIPREQLKLKADELGISIGGSVDPGYAKDHADEYYVRYAGRNRFLDQHVGRGNARDRRHSMRIYFTWCEESKRCVVGWLPSHLSTQNS